MPPTKTTFPTPDEIAHQHYMLGQGHEQQGRFKDAHTSYMMAYGTSSIRKYLDAANGVGGQF